MNFLIMFSIVTQILFQFKFSKQGEYVAVAYENDFFIGEVTDVQSTQLGTVQFLEKGYENVFKWPRVEEVCIIDSKFVFAASFDVLSRNNGRTWLVPEYDELNDIAYTIPCFSNCQPFIKNQLQEEPRYGTK